MTTRPKLTPSQWEALAAAGRGDLYRVGASSSWSAYGSTLRHSDATIRRLVDAGYLECGQTRRGHPLRRITQDGRRRLGWKSPGQPSATEAAARAAAADHERIAP